REKERDPDHRFRTRSRTRARIDAAGSGTRSLSAALPTDPDDDAGCRARRTAAGDRLRRRCGIAPPARRRHHWRSDRQPGIDVVDDAGGLSAARPLALQAAQRTQTRTRRTGAGTDMMKNTMNKNSLAAFDPTRTQRARPRNVQRATATAL